LIFLISKEFFVINNHPITIVYFAYLLGRWDVFFEQMKLIKESGLYDTADKFYMCLSIKDYDLPKVQEILKFYPKIILYSHGDSNVYEYPGIKCFYDTAEGNGYSFYFHTKNIANRSNLNEKIKNILHKNIIMNHKDCIAHLENGASKVSCFKSSAGFCWFNFFWANGSFVKTLEDPIQSTNRYYYEEWSKGDVNGNFANLFNKPLSGEETLRFCMNYQL
jgi:hypothetical protein